MSAEGSAETDALGARLAAVEALAENTPTEYDKGRVDQRHDMTGELLEALLHPPT